MNRIQKKTILIFMKLSFFSMVSLAQETTTTVVEQLLSEKEKFRSAKNKGNPAAIEKSVEGFKKPAKRKQGGSLVYLFACAKDRVAINTLNELKNIKLNELQ